MFAVVVPPFSFSALAFSALCFFLLSRSCSLLRSPFASLFFLRALFPRSFFPCSLLLARFCARARFLCSLLRLFFALAFVCVFPRSLFSRSFLALVFFCPFAFGSFFAPVSFLFPFCRTCVIVRARFGLLRRWFRAPVLLLCSWSCRAPFSLAFSSCSPAPAPFCPVWFSCRFLPFSSRVSAFSLLS